jgi:hypothetical protein
MTVPKSTIKTPTPEAPASTTTLPPKRARRRSTRPSHSWCFRQPPSRKRVETACARGLPEPATIAKFAAEIVQATDREH